MKREWVSGWLTQLALLALGIVALWHGKYEAASIYLTGSLVIGAMRQIEHQRRESAHLPSTPPPRDPDAPPPARPNR